MLKSKFCIWLACFFALMSLLFSSCDPLKPGYKECEKDESSYYEFNLPVYYTPNSDTMQLGDTIWIESRFSNQLYNEHNGKTYTLNNFNFGLDGALNDLSTNPTIGYPGFLLVDTSGNVDNTNKNGAHFSIKHEFHDNAYYWKKGIVLNKPGAFFIDIVSNFSYDQLSKSGQNITKCPNEFASMKGAPMNTSNNYYLLDISPDPYIKQGENAFKYCFIFYVKE